MRSAQGQRSGMRRGRSPRQLCSCWKTWRAERVRSRRSIDGSGAPPEPQPRLDVPERGQPRGAPAGRTRSCCPPSPIPIPCLPSRPGPSFPGKHGVRSCPCVSVSLCLSPCGDIPLSPAPGAAQGAFPCLPEPGASGMPRGDPGLGLASPAGCGDAPCPMCHTRVPPLSFWP